MDVTLGDGNKLDGDERKTDEEKKNKVRQQQIKDKKKKKKKDLVLHRWSYFLEGYSLECPIAHIRPIFAVFTH